MVLLSPTTAFNPIGAMMLLSVRPCAVSSPPSPPLAVSDRAERSGAAHSQQLTAEIRHCVTAPPSHALVLPSAANAEGADTESQVNPSVISR